MVTGIKKRRKIIKKDQTLYFTEHVFKTSVKNSMQFEQEKEFGIVSIYLGGFWLKEVNACDAKGNIGLKNEPSNITILYLELQCFCDMYV